MSMKIPAHWKEEDYRKAISSLMQESSAAMNKGNFLDSAKMLVAAANIIKEIPSARKREELRVKVNKFIKNKRTKIDKPDEETTVIKKPEGSSPFEKRE